jgi:lipopolysaccharide export system protein LptA
MKNQKNKILVLIALLVSYPFSYAEKADRDKPIEIEADTMTVDDAKSTSIYSGDVILTQGTLLIRADELIVRQDKQGFQHSTSLGNPTTFKQKMEGSSEYIQGKALRIEYDGHMDKIHLYKNAEVKRGKDIVVGDYITYDANAEVAQAMSSKTENGEKGRTKAIIKPKD